MFVFAYTMSGIIYAILFVIVALAAFAFVIGGASSVVIKRTTSLNWGQSCLLGAAIGVGGCWYGIQPNERLVETLTIKAEDVVYAVGVSRRYDAIATFKGGGTDGVRATWSSSSPNVKIDNVGQGVAVSPGPATITAKVGDVEATLPVTVSAITLESIELEPSAMTLKENGLEEIKATGIWSDKSRSDLTLLVKRKSSNISVVSVDGPRTYATAMKPGDADVIAEYLGVTATCKVHVVERPDS